LQGGQLTKRIVERKVEKGQQQVGQLQGNSCKEDSYEEKLRIQERERY